MAPRRHRFANARKAAGYTQESLAAALGVDRTTVIRWEAGDNEPQPYYWPQLTKLLDVSREELGRLITGSDDPPTAADTVTPAAVERLAGDRPVLDRRAVLRGAAATALVLSDAEALRRELTEAVEHAAMSDASLDDWEYAVQQYGLVSRYQPAVALLRDLTADFAELCRVLERRRAILVPNRLNRIVAQLAGLMTIPLNRLDQPVAARHWARTAKLVAQEAGDNTLHAWVLAQQAYTQFYSGNIAQAASVAAHAQQVARQAPCPGVAAAAAIEGRAQALMGRSKETHLALNRAEQALSRLEASALAPSAFGYNEAKFRFHAGNAYTHLGETASALGAHERALSLYPTSEYLDPALVRLDRAECLIADNDVPAAADWVARALQSVGPEQRNSMIDNRARQVLRHVPSSATTLPAVRELRDQLQTATAP